MVLDEEYHPLPQSGGRFQPGQYRLRNLGAVLGVAGKVAPAICIPVKSPGLSCIVEQCGPAQHHILRRGLHHMGRMGEHIIYVVGAVLRKIKGWDQLRDHMSQYGPES